MNIKLKNTKLVDEQKRPLLFFHATPQNDIKHFYPLSHFGTQRAANMRAMYFFYDQLKLPQPMVMPQMPNDALLEKLVQQKNPLPLSTYRVYLYSQSALRIPDLGCHTFERYYHWFRNGYRPKQRYLSQQERQEAQVKGEGKTQYKSLLTHFIFVDPFTRTKQDLEKELEGDSLFIPPSHEEPVLYDARIPTFLKTVKHIRAPLKLAERVGFQRLIHFLEGEGYDAFVYRNQYEDRHNDSYIIFRPEQIFSPYDPQAQHSLPTKNDAFSSSVEKQFFESYSCLCPTERIQHRRMLIQQKRQNKKKT